MKMVKNNNNESFKFETQDQNSQLLWELMKHWDLVRWAVSVYNDKKYLFKKYGYRLGHKGHMI